MLCDSPSYYEREPETTHYIASIPTVFDQSFIQSGKVGESIVSVREKDGKWYVGGLTNWDSREVSVDFSFLPEGKWTAYIYQDGVNADRFGQDYRMSKKEVDNSSCLTIRMAQGGGFAIILEK
jgi:alpha-glucosidase